VRCFLERGTNPKGGKLDSKIGSLGRESGVRSQESEWQWIKAWEDNYKRRSFTQLTLDRDRAAHTLDNMLDDG